MHWQSSKNLYLKITGIFVTQNIFHPASKNARDRQQIKTLRKQMYPDHSKCFSDKSKKAIDKRYGKLTKYYGNRSSHGR